MKKDSRVRIIKIDRKFYLAVPIIETSKRVYSIINFGTAKSNLIEKIKIIE